ncbi:hypothetical protein SAMN05444920_115185 [Nonomuraea solani]|uniref:TfuA-like core domain-containing protein n=1 Tax=Nonomuraea solani TaxID=1144553 RepID=A0A1H6ET79_9ACTN|nr:TfuA-like protein [Nonomuraea solani]SEH00206.1 hypothetical protein SAMN05444920_115185 [Nonomuraea solani]
MTRHHVFAGPTVPAARVQALLPGARVHPPVAHGDLLRLDLDPGDVVAIIDGVFYRSAAVRHKEILYLLSRGVAVLGAGSMGALRAAELDSFGMRGVGVVYRLFSLGLLEADDEVAVLHGPAETGYAQHSVALVNVRFAARRARWRGALSRTDECALVEAARSLPFGDRAYASIAEAAMRRGVLAEAAHGFMSFATDVKRADAERLLRLVPAVTARPSSVAVTSFLHEWLQEARETDVGGVPVTDVDVLTYCRLFAADYPRFHHRHTLAALAGEPTVDVARLERLACARAESLGILPVANLADWTHEEERDGPYEAMAARILVRAARRPPGIPLVEPLIEGLRRETAFEDLRHRTAGALRLGRDLATRAGVTEQRISWPALREFFARRWGRVDALTLMDRGFITEADFERRARRFGPAALMGRVPAFSLKAGAHA